MQLCLLVFGGLACLSVDPTGAEDSVLWTNCAVAQFFLWILEVRGPWKPRAVGLSSFQLGNDYVCGM